MKVVWNGGHPDEGSMHAWLDGEIDADDAALLDAHVRTCADCTTAVAEARGLVAGASRVVGMLDDAPPAHIRPTGVRASDTSTAWRFLRVTPTRAAIAAVLLVAIGITLTRKQGAFDPVSPAPSEVASAAMDEPPPPRARDNLLDSAIARRIATEQPPRGVGAAPGLAVTVPVGGSAAGTVAQAPSADAATRVAAGRASLRAQAETLGAFAADRAVFSRSNGAAAPAAPGRDVVAAEAAERAVGNATNNPSAVNLLASRCMRLESTGTAAAAWGGEPLPVTLVFDATGRSARVFNGAGTATEASSVVLAATADSTVIRLRRIGYDGVLTVAGSGETRVGSMRSGQSTLALSQVVVTGGGAARADKRLALRGDSNAPGSAKPAAAQPAASPAIATRPSVPIAALFVSCPTG
ncbi:MAG: zf-HC2 domain-containing protein [Gemmatimonadaceae bacterium]